jgi:hypothetical protein
LFDVQYSMFVFLFPRHPTITSIPTTTGIIPGSGTAATCVTVML